MSRASLIHDLNEGLRDEYGFDRAVSDPINVRDLAIILMALKQGKAKTKRV
jgi:hypothetical protein